MLAFVNLDNGLSTSPCQALGPQAVHKHGISPNYSLFITHSPRAAGIAIYIGCAHLVTCSDHGVWAPKVLGGIYKFERVGSDK